MYKMSVLTLFAAGLIAGPTVADDAAKKKAPVGSYIRMSGEMDLKLEFKKDNVMAFHIVIGDVGCVMTSKYTVEKDGTYKCEVTDFEKKGDFPVSKEKGYKFSFKFEVKEKTAVLSDLMGDEIQDEQKKAVEGEFDKSAGD